MKINKLFKLWEMLQNFIVATVARIPDITTVSPFFVDIGRNRPITYTVFAIIIQTYIHIHFISFSLLNVNFLCAVE